MELRALAAPDLDAALAVLRDAAPPAYRDALADALRGAVGTPGDEARATGAWEEGELAGVVVHGAFAGAVGAGRLHGIAVAAPRRYAGIGTALLAHTMRELRARGSRFLLAEVPDDPPALGDYWAFLARGMFREEARVDDLVRDGVALAYLRRELEG